MQINFRSKKRDLKGLSCRWLATSILAPGPPVGRRGGKRWEAQLTGPQSARTGLRSALNNEQLLLVPQSRNVRLHISQPRRGSGAGLFIAVDC